MDIEKPFETIPIGPKKGVMYYAGAQYAVLGVPDDFKGLLIDDVYISVTDSHPITDIEEDHFVIEVSPLSLKWDGSDEIGQDE